MRLALAMSLGMMLTGGTASAAVVFQDGNFTNYAGGGYTTWTCGPTAAGATPFGQWVWKGNEAGNYYYGSPEATGGNPGAWLHALQFGDERAMVGLAAPVSGTKWDISFDYIASGNINPGAPVLHVLGYKNGDTQSRGAGTALNGTLIGDITTTASDTWTTQTGSVTIDGTYDGILLMFSANATAGASTVGFDNVLVTDQNAVPEPATLSLLGLGALGLLRRRR